MDGVLFRVVARVVHADEPLLEEGGERVVQDDVSFLDGRVVRIFCKEADPWTVPPIGQPLRVSSARF